MRTVPHLGLGRGKQRKITTVVNLGWFLWHIAVFSVSGEMPVFPDIADLSQKAKISI